MYIAASDSCCGLAEIGGFLRSGDNPSKEELQDEFLDILDQVLNENFSFYVFADVTKTKSKASMYKVGGATKFARWLKKHELGNLVVTSPKVNAKSTNVIRAWLWSPDRKLTKEKMDKIGLTARREEIAASPWTAR